MSAGLELKVSVVLLTYNWPQALERMLEGLARQSQLPYEVIVADDGSTEETAALVQRMAASFPVPLRHIWRKTMVSARREHAIAVSPRVAAIT